MRLTRFNGTDTGSTHNVCGLLVHALPERLAGVSETLSAMPGIEIHATSPDGRLVVTAEDAGEVRAIDAIGTMNDIQGIVSVALVYHHFDSDTSTGDLP